jgi:ankyrin repeat protein
MSTINVKQLYEYARIGDIEPLCSTNWEIEPVEGQNGRTILHAAAENGDPELLKMLFDMSAGRLLLDRMVDDNGQTPLHVACSHGHTAAAQYMIEELDFDPRVEDLHGKTALSCAADAMAIDLMEYLRGKAEPAFPVCDAALPGHIALLRWRLDHGGDVEETGETSFWDELTPLIAAIRGGCREAIELLLDAGASPQRPAGEAGSPLHHAVEIGDTAICALLIERGACVNDWSSLHSYAPLHFAIERRNVECITLLLDKGADPNDKVGDDFHIKYLPISPLFLAVREGTPEIVELLLDHGADPEDHATGFTTLYQVKPDTAVGQMQLETTTTIAIQRALIYRPKIADILLGKGVDPNRRNEIGATLLHLVAATPEVGVEPIKLLLARGADPTIRTNGGATPYDLAVQMRNKAAADALRDETKRRLRPRWRILMDRILDRGSDVGSNPCCSEAR